MTRARAAVLVAVAIGAAVPADAQSSTCDLAAMATSVMNACCLGGGGHRRLQQKGPSCAIPATCPSANCAATFDAFWDSCSLSLGRRAA